MRVLQENIDKNTTCQRIFSAEYFSCFGVKVSLSNSFCGFSINYVDGSLILQCKDVIIWPFCGQNPCEWHFPRIKKFRNRNKCKIIQLYRNRLAFQLFAHACSLGSDTLKKIIVLYLRKMQPFCPNNDKQSLHGNNTRTVRFVDLILRHSLFCTKIRNLK